MAIKISGLRGQGFKVGVSLSGGPNAADVQLDDVHLRHGDTLVIVRDPQGVRDALGLPNSVTTNDMLQAAEIAKGNERGSAVKLITALTTWATLGDSATALAERFWSWANR